MVDLSGVKEFKKGPSPYKYTAILDDGTKVRFGNAKYEHYKDSVPTAMGGGEWSHKDHDDADRRKNYRARHGPIKTKSGGLAKDKKYSPAWFSWNLLW